MFLKAIKSKKVNHEHIGYISPTGGGITSTDSGHSHEIVQEPVVNRTVDELGNITEQVVGMRNVVKEAKGHVHELAELEIADVPDAFTKTSSEKEELDIAYDLWRTAQDLEDDWYREAENDEEFYKGNQWDAAIVGKLQKNKRATLTINELKPKADLIVGHQKQNRTDTIVLPEDTGDQRVTDIYNHRIKNVYRKQRSEDKESAAFEDAIIVGRGGIQVDIDTSKNIMGDIVILKRHWKDIFFGEHEEVDASDADYAGVQAWHSLASLKKLYPKKYEDITVDFELRNNGFNVEPSDKRDYFYRKTPDIEFMRKQRGTVDLATKRYKLIEVQRKIFKRVSVLFNASDNFYFDATGMSESDFKKAESIEGINHAVANDYKIRKVIFAGSVLLARSWSVFKDINITPAYGNKRGSDIWGIIRGAKDAQKELNKRSSQYIDIVNYGARYSLLMAPEAFSSQVDYEEWLEKSMDPTYQPKLKEGFQAHMHQLQGFKYPNEIVGTINVSREAIERIMNINDSMMGVTGENRSGVAIAQKIRQGWIGNERYYDNLSITKKRVCKLVLQAIKVVDSPEKLLRLTEASANLKNPIENAPEMYPPMSVLDKISHGVTAGLIGPQDAQVLAELAQKGEQMPVEAEQVLNQAEVLRNKQMRKELLDILQDDDIMRYDVAIAESAYSPNVMFSNFLMMVEMASKGIPIPPDQIIEQWPGMSGIQKNKLLDSLRAQQETQQAAEDKKYDAQIQQALISHQGKIGQQGGLPQ